MSEVDDVPIISLKGFISGSAEERAVVVEQVKHAAEKCGFLVIQDHGADEAVIATAWQAVRDFFDTPLENKEGPLMTEAYPYGYSGIEAEFTGGDLKSAYGAADRKESFAVCLGPATGGDPKIPPVQWPASPASLPGALTAYYREMERFARVLLRVLALALRVDEHFFDALEDRHWSALRCLNYPHSDKPFEPGQQRIAAHTDYGTVTILRADNTPGGLQVQRLAGGWLDVFLPPGCYVVNLGDLLQRWTNDRWKSTVHRVVPPPVDGSGVDNRRQSIAFFHNLNRDAVCAVFDSCVDAEHPRKYEPINAFEHLMARHAASTGVKRFEAPDSPVAEKPAAAVAAPDVGGAAITDAAWAQAAAAGGAGGV